MRITALIAASAAAIALQKLADTPPKPTVHHPLEEDGDGLVFKTQIRVTQQAGANDHDDAN